MAEQPSSKMLDSLPVEIQIMIMARLPDIRSLDALARTDESASEIIAAPFAHIFPHVIRNSLPFDLQELVCILILAYDPPSPREQLFSILNPTFDRQTRQFRLYRCPRNPIKSLRLMGRIITAIQFFTDVYPKFYACRRKVFEPRNLEDMEVHRLQRGFLRFEICCALIELWKPTQCIEVARSGANTRLAYLEPFLKQFTQWEIEELMCIYDFLEMAVFDYDNVEFQKTTDLVIGSRNTASLSSMVCAPSFGMSTYRFRGARYLAACTIGIAAPHKCLLVDEDDPWDVIPSIPETEQILRAATRARVLSQGLRFLRAFQTQPLSIKKQIEVRLKGCALGDEFIHAALASLKANPSCPFGGKDTLLACRSYPWDGVAEDERTRPESRATDMANKRWIRFVHARDASYRNRRPPYPIIEEFRAWGHAIWNYPLQCASSGQKDPFGETILRYCECSSCLDIWRI